MGSKTFTTTGLTRAADHLGKIEAKARDKLPHDRLHMLPSGSCGCMCPKCWRWLAGKLDGPRVGVCLCMSCRCGGMPGWYPAGGGTLTAPGFM